MRILSTEEIKDVELNLLEELYAVCKFYGFKVYLCGGTLLGAVRHGGFIPWDDDIDVCMPRPDYDRFIELSSKTILFPKHIRLICYENGEFDFPFAKLVDTRTKIDRACMEDGGAESLWVDILPVDGMPDSTDEYKLNVKVGNHYRNRILRHYVKLGTGTTFLRAMLKIPAVLVAKGCNVRKLSSKLINIGKKYPYSSARMVGIFVWGLYGDRERMPKDKFELAIPISFENRQFETMACYKEYLSNLYGDYMQMPPVSKRIAHRMTAWIEEGCE